MTRLTTYKQPSTFAEMLGAEYHRHSGRLAELKRAEKMIRAIESDLTFLAENGVHFATDAGSMCLGDGRAIGDLSGRAKPALHLSAGAFRDSGDRLIAGFLTLGWLVDLTDLKGIPVAVLRRPKTQVRVKIYGTDEYIGNLRPQEAS